MPGMTEGQCSQMTGPKAAREAAAPTVFRRSPPHRTISWQKTQRGALANAARSDSQRSALHRALHRTASNALQRNEERKIILPRHHEDFRPNSQALQPKQESNLTKSAEDFNPIDRVF